METFELNNNHGRFMERYINEHLYTMIVLIEKKKSDEYNVVYANTLAIDYFSGNVLMSDKHFFRHMWQDIKKELKYLKESPIHKTRISVQNKNKKTLFELNLQRNENGFVCLEMKELEDATRKLSALNDLRNNYESMIENNLDTIITVNNYGEIVNVNKAAQSILGFLKTDFLNESIYKFIQIAQVDSLEIIINDAFQGVLTEPTEINILHKKKLFLPAFVQVLPMSENGVVTELNLIIRDLSRYYEYDKKFTFLSYRDQLTGLFNRKSLKKDFTDFQNEAEENGQKMALIHIGLDRFKLINDALGHNGADEILKSVGNRMNNICPDSCKVYRNGGDEFIIIVNDHVVGKTEEIARMVLGEFGRPFHFNSHEYFISASIGISVYPDDGRAIESLIQKSEQAMFYVKDNGRSHFHFYADEMKSLMSDEVLLESHLRRAIELDEFEVYYQPQIDLKTGKINSFEALLRWNNRKFGFVSPLQFIQIAEDSGLIHSIGDWVLNQACAQLREWQNEGYHNVSIAVNISSKQFKKSGFEKDVEASIFKHQIKPSSLELEITESSLANMEETIGTLNELKEIGVRISVDDFGTGYSSLSYLKQYPIDIIKIDQSFIKDIELDEKNQAIAKTIINLAQNLGMEVIAEGVENSLQAEILLEAQCQKAQGFLYSKALPVCELEDKYFSMLMK